MNIQTAAPARQLKTNRGLLKLIVLSFITFGIYGLVYYSSISEDVNSICGRYDGRKTMHFCLLFFLVGPLTWGIGVLVWYHRISDRIGNELRRRGIAYSFGAGSFWLWNLFGTLLFGIGPFVYVHKLSKAINLLSVHYNVYG